MNELYIFVMSELRITGEASSPVVSFNLVVDEYVY